MSTLTLAAPHACSTLQRLATFKALKIQELQPCEELDIILKVVCMEGLQALGAHTLFSLEYATHSNSVNTRPPCLVPLPDLAYSIE